MSCTMAICANVADAAVHALDFAAPNWTVAAAGTTFSAPIVVNAAGAWADDLARRAGIEPLGLVPMRRTAMLMDIPEGSGAASWPMVIDIGLPDELTTLGVRESDLSPSRFARDRQ